MNTTAESPQNERVVKTKRTQLDALIPKMNDKMKIIDGWHFLKILSILLGRELKYLNWNVANFYYPYNRNWNLTDEQAQFINSLGGKYSTANDAYRLDDVSKNFGTISKVFTQDDFYIFATKEGYTFHVQIHDFDTNGLNAKSLKFGKPSLDTASNLVKDFTISSEGHSLNLLKGEKIISTIVGDLISVVDKDTGDVIVVNENLLEYIRIGSSGKQIPQGDPIAHPYGTIKKIKVDKNSNFLLIVSEYDGNISKLHIVNRKTLEEVENHEGIVDIIQIDTKNDLTCLDSDGKLVSIDTNFDQFEKSYVDSQKIGKKRVTEIKNVALSQLEALLGNGGIQIDASSLGGKNTAPPSLSGQKKVLAQKIWEISVGDVTLKELFESASSMQEIETVYQAFLLIQQTPEIEAISGITTDIERAIIQKKQALLLTEIQQIFQEIKTEFEQLIQDTSLSSFFSRLLALKMKLEDIELKRSQNFSDDVVFDNDISDLKDSIQAQIMSHKIKHEAKLFQEIEENMRKISDVLKNIIYPLQITQIYNNPFYIRTCEMIEFLEDSKQDTYKKQLQELIQARMDEIRKIEEQKKSGEEQKIKNMVQGIEKDIENLGNIISSIEEESTLESFRKSDTLVQKILSDIEKTQKSDAEKLLLSLEGIFTQRKQNIRLKKREEKGVIRNLDEYGIDTALYFSDRVKKQIGFQLSGQRTAQNTIKLEIIFENGTIFNIDTYLQNSQKYASGMLFSDIPHDLSPSEFLKLQKNIAEYRSKGEKEIGEILEKLIKEDYQDNDEKEKLKEKVKKLKEKYKSARVFNHFATHLANTLNLNPRSRLELPNPRFIVLNEEQELLQSMSIGFMIQKNEQNGIDILEGPPGLGKTEICRFFAANTNREIVRIQCSKMDPSDLFFSPQLKAGETSRQAAEWIQLMQKPGTIILFDEIDKLNPQSFERLHSLFDNARGVYDPQMGWVKAHKDCIFIGTRNSYEKMSNPIVSRSTITQIKAPSRENEAYKIAKYTGISYFENISFQEFQKLIQQGAPQHIEKTLQYIMKLVLIFSDLRDLQKSNASRDTFMYEISYRDAEKIFRRFSQSTGKTFKEITTEILVPKARAVVLDAEDKDIQENILKEVIKKHL